MKADGSSFASTQDRILAAKLSDGMPEAYETVRRWIRSAARPFRSSIGAELEDLEQDVLLALTGSLRRGSFEGRSSLSTYVKRAVVYRCLNRVRDAGRRTFVPSEEVRLEWNGPDPFQTTARREEVLRALEVIDTMPAECRELWRLVREGASYRQMSDRLGIAAGTLRVRMLRCRRRAVETWERLTGTSR